MLGNMIQRIFVFVVVSAILSGIPLSAQSNKIHISAPSKSLSWFPIHLTREKGFYRAEGLDVDYVIMKPQIAMQALIAGDVGYTTALGSTIRAALRNVPLRVVMTIADKPLFALMARPSIDSVEELRGKLIGISSFGASTDTYARALLRRFKLIPNQDVKIIALGGGMNRIAAMEAGAIDAAAHRGAVQRHARAQRFPQDSFCRRLDSVAVGRLRHAIGKDPEAT